MFQVHLWSGLPLGLYVLVIGLSGSVLVFEPELEALEYPQYFAIADTGTTLADPAIVLRNVQAAYPGFRVGSVNWPAPQRNSFVSYPSKGQDIRTVFAHPVSGEVLGELPDDGFARWMWNLHVYLLSGRIGLKVSGALTGCLIIVALTGLVLWWPGLVRWSRALMVDFGRGWKRITWELHSAVGFWTMLVLLLWSITGIYLAFPQGFRAVLTKVSPLSTRARPVSDPARRETSPLPEPRRLVERALGAVPGSYPARYTAAVGDRGSIVVVVDRDVIGDRVVSGETWVHFDRYDGRLLGIRPQVGESAGDLLMAWMFPLHAGWFAGLGIKILWAILGLSFPVLVVTGTIMWWNRVITPKRVEINQQDRSRRSA